MQPRRVLGYARVSSAEQALGTSLEDQQAAIRRYAAARGLKVDRMYVEAESAVHEKAERRVQIQALCAETRAGDLVVVDKVDRWSRDPEFTYRSVRELAEKGARIYFVAEDCDPSTDAGDSMLGMRAYFAREEHKRIRVRTVGTRKLLRDRGYYVEGLAPWGYRRQGVKGVDRNVLVLLDAEAALIRDAFRRCIAGESMSAIAEHLGDTTDRVKIALHNRVYLGEVRNASGAWITGRHPAIVDAFTFAEAQRAIESRRLGSRRTREGSETSTWWLRDVARCALCGGKMSAAYAGPDQARRHYFRCYARCTTSYVRVPRLEEVCEPLVLERLHELRDLLRRAHAAPTVPRPLVDVEAKLRALDRRRVLAGEAYMTGAFSREELQARVERIDEERDRLRSLAIPPPPVPRDAWRRLRLTVASLARAWSAAAPEERRTIVNALARAVRVAAGKAPVFDWVEPEELARRA